MDVRVSAVTPTPLGTLDVGEQVRNLLAMSPFSAALEPIVSRVLMPAGEQLGGHIGKIINVTVIVINDSHLGDINGPTSEKDVSEPTPAKAAARKQAQPKKSPATKTSASKKAPKSPSS